MSSTRSARYVWLFVLAGAIVAAVIVVPLFRGSGSRPAGPAGLAGQRAADFPLNDVAGARVSLSQLRGRVVIVNLWASWCPPCRAEMPELQRFADAYAKRGVAVVGVNQGESAQRAREFAQSLKIRFPIWLDERQVYGRAYTALGLPTTVVVGRDGTIVRGFDGPLTFGELQAAVAGAIGGPAR